jgi:galactose mutarotase-like enzyme
VSSPPPLAEVTDLGPPRSTTAATGDIVLVSGEARLRVALLGAEARGWSVGGVELLWPGDPAIWPDVSPILFPIVGWTRDGIRVAGKRYHLGVHGFARTLTFEIESASADFVGLVAHDGAATRALYPFAFAFRVEHRLAPGSWEVALEIENKGAFAMPYACGLHPGFNWPFAGADRTGAQFRFASPERPEVPVIAPGGLFSKRMRRIPLDEGTTLPLDDALFAREALCFLDAASRSVRFEQADGSALEMAVDDFPHLALWTKPGAPFLSLESWTGYGDPVGFAGDLAKKPSMRILRPHEIARHRAVYRFHPAARAEA